MNKFFLYWTLFLICCFSSTSLLAQTENCGDGIDNDGDGLIDEYDPDCCNNPSLDAFYDPCTSSDCSFQGSLDDITLNTLFVSTAKDYRTLSVPVFGDIDGDGHTEIIIDRHNQGTNGIDILDGVTHQVKETIDISTNGNNQGIALAIGDILDADGNAGQDGQAEIVVSVGGGRVHILRRPNGVDPYGIHRTIENVVNSASTSYTLTPNITDFDQDGIAEIHCGYFIIDPATGIVMNSTVPMNAAGDNGRGTVVTSSTTRNGILFMVAADVDGTRDLELVGGNTLYSVNIDRSNPAAPSATLGLVRSANGMPNDGYTAIADWDNDGDLDGIVTTIDTIDGDSSQFYVWDLQTSTVLNLISVLRLNNTDFASVGRANIGDLDGDGQVEAVFCHNNGLIAIDNDFTLMWGGVLPTGDRSGLTGVTMFDFDGNGTTEIVYRDETDLRILDGSTGLDLESTPCFSSTALEYPVVGDIDNNGTTELLVICDSDTSDNSTAPEFFTYRGELRIYQPTNTAWMPSRGVWNQNNYFYTNIKDDLTIPMIQQNPHLPGDLNMFNNQYADMLGRVPDATGELEEAYCNLSGDFITINLDISNIGDRILSSAMPISIYSSNPLTANSIHPAILLATVNPLTANLGVGSSTIISIQIPAANYTSEYFILLNDNGANTADPNNFPYNPNNPYASNIAECNYLNNLVVVEHPSCCFAAASPDYTKIEPAQGETTVTISGYHEIWPDKVYIPDGVTVIVENSAILDITNSDVVFGVGAGIDVVGNGKLLAYNSVFRPCDIIETWRGVLFGAGMPGLEGSIKECTFINAETAISIDQLSDSTELAEVELKNNLFTNCYRGIQVNYEIAEPNIQVSGNTFEWGAWDNITYNILPSDLDFVGIELINTGELNTRDFHPITQNSFANNTNYTSILLNHSIGGILVHAGNADVSASNNQFTNLNYAFKVIADSEFGNPKISFENNFIEVTRRSNKDVQYQIEITRAEPNFSTVAYISGNTIVNSALVDETLLTPTDTLFNNTLIGTGAIYSNNSAHIVDNYVRGFEVGIFADGSAIGEGTQPIRISNNAIEAFIYGVYRRGFANVMHTIITCNEIDMKQTQDGESINSIGICYQIEVATAEGIGDPNYVNPSLGFISDNCISNTDMAIQIVNSSNVAGGDRLPPSLHVENNFMQNYHNVGFDIHDFEHIGTFVRRNTFFSNNKTNGAIDIGRTVNVAIAGGTVFDVDANDYGSTAIAWSNVSVNSSDVAPSSATCAGQDAGEESGLDFVDCNDEDILGETLTPAELTNLNGGTGATTAPSGLPYPKLGNYTSQGIVKDAEVKASELYVFPNPTNNELTISFDNLLEGAKVLKVYNALGQIVKTMEFSNSPVQKTISVEDLTTGVYEIILLDSRGLAGTSQFIKK
jgi:hypothetical protein